MRAELKKGQKLTIASDIIGNSGSITFKKGDKVTVSEVIKTKRRWSEFFNMFLPETIDGVKINEAYGIWFLSAFEETNTFNP